MTTCITRNACHICIGLGISWSQDSIFVSDLISGDVSKLEIMKIRKKLIRSTSIHWEASILNLKTKKFMS